MKDRKNKDSLKPGESLFAVLIAGFSVVALWQAYQISGFSGLSTPGIFPMLAAGTMLVSSLFILSDALSRQSVESKPDALKTKVLTWRLSLMVALIALYIFAMPYIGFMASSAVFLWIAFIYLWRKNIGVSLLLTAATLTAIYLIFRILFQVVLPTGTLFQGW